MMQAKDFAALGFGAVQDDAACVDPPSEIRD